jgi:hypothetical protein
MAPVNVVIICSYVGALAAIDDPNGTWAHIAAFLPPFAPLVVPARVVIGDMGAAGLLASVTIELVAAVLLVRAAARIYERSILQIGAPISLTSALHAGREPRLPVPRRLLQLPGRARHHPQGLRRDGDAAPRSPARAGGAAAEPPLRRGRVGWKGGPHR